MILAGGGVVIGGAIDECRALAERLDAPVCSGYQHNDSFPGSHPLAAGPLGYNGSKAAMELIAQADVVLALGTRLNPFSTLPGYGIDYWPRDAAIIQVELNPDRIGLTKKVTVGICGDAKKVARQLCDRLSSTAGDAGREQRRAAIHQTRSAWLQTLASMDHEDDDPGTTWNVDARTREPDRMSARMAWRAIQDRPAQGRHHLVGHRQQLRHRQRLSDLRGGPQVPRARPDSAPAATASPPSSAPRSAALTCLWWASPATAPSASR